MTRVRGALPLVSAALALAIGLSGCVGPLPGSGDPPQLFDLTPKSTFDQSLPQANWQLVIEEPVAAASLDTNRIALRRSATTVDYLKGVAWTDRAPRLVQTLMVESFENSARIVSVGRESIGLRSDYVLKTDLREFQAEYFGPGPPRVRVRINVKLVKWPERAIIASTSAESVAEPAGSGADQVVMAFDEALGKVLKRIVEWALRAPGPRANSTAE